MTGTAKGVTLVEIMIAVVILTALLTIALLTLSGNRKKQYLSDTGNGLYEILLEAQSEAIAQKRIKGVCFKSGTNGQYAQIYEPALSSAKLPTDSDCVSGESLEAKVEFRPNVTLCANCDANVAVNKSIFFSPDNGFPMLYSGTSSKFEICLISSLLPSGTRAREVEVLAGGLVQLVQVGKTGDSSSVAANAGNCI